VVECLSSICEAVGLIPSTERKKKNKKRVGVGGGSPGRLLQLQGNLPSNIDQ
jgi:hypothetical protein